MNICLSTESKYIHNFLKKLVEHHFDELKRLLVSVGESIIPFLLEPKEFAKPDFEICTTADIQANRIIVTELKKKFPHNSIISEETGIELKKKSLWTWFVDPIDGTANLLQGDSYFSIAIGLAYRDKPVFGIVHTPLLGKTYSGLHYPFDKSRTFAELNGRNICVSKQISLAKSVIVTDWPNKNKYRLKTLDFIKRIYLKTRQIKIRGCASLDICSLAEGLIDGYYHPFLQPWDTCAAVAIAMAAGANVFLLGEHREWNLNSQSIVICSPNIKKEFCLFDILGKSHI